jgi:hypothetical protein
MRKMRTGRRAQRNCRHLETIAIATAGLERVVCETCGYLTVRYLDGGLFGKIVTTSANRIPQRTTRA